MEIKNILVPIDFSDSSIDALRYGVVLARQFGAKILLLYVISQEWISEMKSVQYFSGVVESVEELTEQKKRHTNEKIKEVIEKEGDQDLLEGTLIMVGVPAEVIIDVADEREIDLIIVGTHGRSGLRKVFMGSVAQRVVRRAPCSVLCVRGKDFD